MRQYFSSIISCACLVFISQSVSAQFNAEQLRICSKAQQRQLFDSIVAKSFGNEGVKQNEHHFTFITSDLRAHGCVAVDSSKEIYLENLPVVSSESPYEGSTESAFVLHINSQGYINFADIGNKKKSGEIDLTKKINR